SDDDQGRGLVGVGLARILNLCGPLHVPQCPAAHAPPAEASASGKRNEDVVDLAQLENAKPGEAKDSVPHLDLLGATASGAPNVVSVAIAGAESQGARELDDNYIAMHLGLAQQLVYGRGEHKATGIVLQLRRTEDMTFVRTRLKQIIADHHLDLEVRDFGE